MFIRMRAGYCLAALAGSEWFWQALLAVTCGSHLYYLHILTCLPEITRIITAIADRRPGTYLALLTTARLAAVDTTTAPLGQPGLYPPSINKDIFIRSES
ncbi:hypothetical protein TKWG_15295 [Advenella kashmirensis WT001]|uniref:Uncharacterized protein n=1 Tax=Advenella kashmirensis (strain DSM 17095 / LMG 22695 / WT001) TaxID=1036672 RepID=I3UDI3_ADVKW|nr:hypothetical protein TKWG_15295 [Advenella kashmirensis WT001]